MSKVKIQVTPLPHFEGLVLPAYETALSAGMDLRAAVLEDEPLALAPGQRVLVSIRRARSTLTIAAK
jgi:dUTP pyrophosphatase